MHMRSVLILLRSGSLPVGLLIALLGIGLPPPAAGQAAFPGAPEEPSVNLRVYPLDAWSPRVGAGLGLGLVAHHLGRRNAQALVTAGPARHEQVAAVAWASANPARAEQYVLVNARGLHTNRDWFYGLGPRSVEDARQSIERSALTVRLRAGQHFWARRLLVQPTIGLATHRVDRVPAPTASGLDARSQRHLQQLASRQVGLLRPEETGLRVGLDLQYDTRPDTTPATRGIRLNAGWRRYINLGSSFVQYNRFDFGALGLLPLGGAHRLAGRLSLTHTSSRGRAPVPYYLRPTLGGTEVPGWARHRFVDSDRLMGSLLYRFPVAQPLGVMRMGGHLGLHAASVYEDVFSDFAFDLTFNDSMAPARASVPLRPAASVGLHLGLAFRQTPSLDLALGVSPEGVTGVRFQLVQNIQALRAPHHQIRHP